MAFLLVLVAAPLSAVPAVAYTPPAVSPFTDVPVTDPAYTEIAWMYDQGISTGWSDGTYRPTEQVNRDAMAAFFYRYKKQPTFTPPTTSPFTDINSSTPFYKEMSWMKTAGISTGWSDGTYRPYTATNRDAMSAFLYRVAGSPTYTPPTTSPFTDITPTTPFYKEMMWLAENGIATDTEDGTFNPYTPVTRATMAIFMYRLANLTSLKVSTSAFGPATVGQSFTATLAAEGGAAPYTWSATGLPAGLSLNGNTVSGTPTAAGASNVAVTVTDSGGQTATRSLGLSVVAPLSITTESLPVGAVGQPYSATLTAAGGVPPASWTVPTPLPAGLSVSATGEISGTPAAAGTSDVTFMATDPEGRTATKTLRFDIAAAGLRITTTSLPPSTVGDSYTTTLDATGGTTPYTWKITNLPSGFSATGNVLSGTPTAPGTTSVSVEVKDASGRIATSSHNLVVADPLAITTDSLPSGSVGVEYSVTLAASGGTPAYAWNATGLPAGLTLNKGVISGTPTGKGTFTVSLTVSDADGRSKSASLNLVIDNKLQITTKSLPGARVGKGYSTTVTAAGGSEPYTWQITGLPAGLVANGAAISGTPSAEGAFQVTVALSDSDSPQQTVSSVMTLAVSEAETGLALVKTVVNAYGTPAAATSWTLKADGPGTASDLSGAGGVPRTEVAAGTYTLSETGTVAGYTNGTTWTCATVAGNPVTVTNNQVTLAAGADVQCTITNTANAPHLSLVKKVVDPLGTPVSASNWTLTADGPGSSDLSGTGGVARTQVDEGTYTLSETGSVAGYVNGSQWACVTAAGGQVPVVQDNRVTLSTGVDVTCTITNTANAPHLRLVKTVVNAYGTPAAATSWTLKADGPGTGSDLSGAGGVPRTEVAAGTYTLSETGTVAGYTNGTTWTCATVAGNPVTVTNNQVTLAAGADVQCTITNTANAPYLSLVKKVVNSGGTAASASNWTLRADGPGSTDLSGAGGVARAKVVEGGYILSEIGSLSGYANGTTWSCVDAASQPVSVTNNTVPLGTGADVTCSITNTAIVASSHIGVGTYSPTPVYRYNNPTSKDWVTVPAHGDFGVPSGYGSQVGPQYYVPLIASGADDMVGIYRYYSTSDKDWVDFQEGTAPASYGSRTFLHYLFKSSGTNRVAVNRWWNATDRDWLTVSANEYADSTLTSWGYTNKTLLGYAHAAQSQYAGYFQLGTPQAGVVSSNYAPGEYPHTMSVLDVNPTNLPTVNGGYRYLGYFGHNECGGINIARSNDLNAAKWSVGGDQPWFPGDNPCRWAFGAIADGSRIAMVVNEQWDTTVTLQMSTDGLSGTEFGNATNLLYAAGDTGIGNPTLFRDPTNNRYYLYYYRIIPSTTTDYLYEIRVKSATTIEGLIGGGQADLGTRIGLSHNTLAAPSMMYANGRYYLAVETKENNVWKTRVMTGSSPTGAFYEVPGNPLYGNGAACVFQHQFGTELHSWYCMQTQAGNADSWRLDHVKGNLLSPS